MTKSVYFKYFSILSILCVGILAYSNSFHCSFHFDDNTSIVDNPAIKNIHDVQAIWTFLPRRFMLYLSIAINYHFNKLDVFGYHLFNLGIHLMSAILVWWFVLLTLLTPALKSKVKASVKKKESLLGQTLDDSIVQHSDLIALLVALVFVSHPIQTQAVTYIVQRAASMATLFYLATLCLYVQSRIVNNKNVSNVFYGCSLLMAMVSMFTKETAITMPLMILLYEFSFFRTNKNFNWQYAVPFLFVLFVIPITMLMTETSAARVEFLRSEPGISSFHYLLTQFRVIATYIRLVILPIHQNLDYDYAISQSFFELPVLISVAFLTAILFAAQRLFDKYRLLGFSIFWFFLTLLPESSFLPIRDVIYEHRLYLPMVGYSLFLVSSLYYLVGKKSFQGMLIILALIIGVNAFLTFQRNKIWKDEFTLWNDVLHKSPHKARPYINLGSYYFNQGDYPKALKLYNQAITMSSKFAEPFYNRGTIYAKQEKFAQALADYNKAIDIDQKRPEIFNNRGLVEDKEGEQEQAMADFSKAIELDPKNGDAYSNRGSIDIEQKDFTQAVSDFSRVIELEPESAKAYTYRGNAYDEQNNFSQAMADYNEAIALNPKYPEAFCNRAVADVKENNLTAAMADYTEAIVLNPKYAEAYSSRGVIEAEQNNFSQAMADYQKAVTINPKYPDVHYNRAVSYYQLKQYAKAWADIHIAQGLGYAVNPNFITALKQASGGAS